MNEIQKLIIDQSIKSVRILDAKRIAVNTLIYALLALALIYFVTQTIDLFSGILILVFALLYSFIKDYTMFAQTKKIIQSHWNYIKTKKPRADLYTPMLEKSGRGMLLKRAALFFENDKMFLEAFRQQAFSTVPKESLTIPFGRDFIITDTYPVPNRNLIIYIGTLMNSPYQFYVVNQTDVVNRIQTAIDNQLKKEVS
jgi:hypothetical protein